MKWFGNIRWLTVVAVAIGVPMLIFFMFEKWFLVPLPKGPLEQIALLVTRLQDGVAG